MPTILVVDDSPIEQHMAGRLLERVGGWKTRYATDGLEALIALNGEQIDLIVSDLQMPRMNGLELLVEVRSRYPRVPLIVMTSRGSEMLAVQALQQGAAGYLPKSTLGEDLVSTAESVLSASGRERCHESLISCLTEHVLTFELTNGFELRPVMVGYLQDCAEQIGICDDRERTRIGIALEEALANAVIHGNLAISSELRGRDDEAYQQLLDERRSDPRYGRRRVFVRAMFDRTCATFVIRDEGDGFDPTSLADPTDVENLLKASGRGVLLMRSFMDGVHYNERGNEVTLVKYAPGWNSGIDQPSERKAAPVFAS